MELLIKMYPFGEDELFRTQCHNCNHVFDAKLKDLLKVIKCPACQADVKLPRDDSLNHQYKEELKKKKILDDLGM